MWAACTRAYPDFPATHHEDPLVRSPGCRRALPGRRAGGGNFAHGGARTTINGPVAGFPLNAATLIGTAATNHAVGVGSLVDALQARGAVNIVVWRVPDVDRSPAALAGEFFGMRCFDVAGTLNRVFASLSSFGLSSVMDACNAVADCNPSTYVFWDAIHPSSAAHALVAGAMLTAVPERTSVLLMTQGVAGLVAARRRQA